MCNETGFKVCIASSSYCSSINCGKGKRKKRQETKAEFTGAVYNKVFNSVLMSIQNKTPAGLEHLSLPVVSLTVFRITLSQLPVTGKVFPVILHFKWFKQLWKYS